MAVTLVSECPALLTLIEPFGKMLHFLGNMFPKFGNALCRSMAVSSPTLTFFAMSLAEHVQTALQVRKGPEQSFCKNLQSVRNYHSPVSSY